MKLFSALFCALVFGLAFAHKPNPFAAYDAAKAARAAQIECHTDSECMALCPASDLDCDGGPQS